VSMPLDAGVFWCSRFVCGAGRSVLESLRDTFPLMYTSGPDDAVHEQQAWLRLWRILRNPAHSRAA